MKTEARNSPNRLVTPPLFHFPVMNIGVVGGNPPYRGTWFGEGKVQIYLDGEKPLPTLVSTGSED